MNPFVIFYRAGRDLFDELFLMMGLNLAWLVISGPLAGVAIWLALGGSPVAAAVVAVLAMLPYAPASAGLAVVAERVVDGRVVTFGMFVAGMREHARFAWKVYGIWAIGLVTLLFNLFFYLQLGGMAGILLTALLLYLTAAWLMLMIYLGPLVVLQEQKSLRLVWRNAAVLSLSRPFFTAITGALMGLIIVLSAWAAILGLLLTAAFLALWSMRSAVGAIKLDAERRALRAEPEQDTTPVADRTRRGQIRPRD